MARRSTMTIWTHGRTSGRGGQQGRCAASSSAALPRLLDDLAPQRRPTGEPGASRPDGAAEATSHVSTIRDVSQTSRARPPASRGSAPGSRSRRPSSAGRSAGANAAPSNRGTKAVRRGAPPPVAWPRAGRAHARPAREPCNNFSALRAAIQIGGALATRRICGEGPSGRRARGPAHASGADAPTQSRQPD